MVVVQGVKAVVSKGSAVVTVVAMDVGGSHVGV